VRPVPPPPIVAAGLIRGGQSRARAGRRQAPGSQPGTSGGPRVAKLPHAAAV